MVDFIALARECAPTVHPATLSAAAGPNAAIGNPLLITLSAARLARQPAAKPEAIAMLRGLQDSPREVFVGLAQVHRRYLARYGVDADTAFEPCENLRLAERIVQDCFEQAKSQTSSVQAALRATLGCYRSGTMTVEHVASAGTARVSRDRPNMTPASLQTLASACAPAVHVSTAAALVNVESGRNPFAIGVVGGALARQPRSLDEAVAAVRWLEAQGWNYSVGLGQINKNNFAHYGLSAAEAFEPCANLAAMQSILGECYQRASAKADPQAALRQAFSCYYSGNFTTGFRHGYVQKVVAASTPSPQLQPR